MVTERNQEGMAKMTEDIEAQTKEYMTVLKDLAVRAPDSIPAMMFMLAMRLADLHREVLICKAFRDSSAINDN